MRRAALLWALLSGCSAPISICGDGVLSSGEACDDGNTFEGDGCRADCFGREACGDFLLDLGEACDDGNQDAGDGCASDCSKLERCGDGIIDIGEECDDGNAVDADGCEADCTLPACQNQIVDPGEVCAGVPNDSPLDALPTLLSFADVNQDGHLDLLSANQGVRVRHKGGVLQGTVSVALGAGNGRFLDRVDYPVHEDPNALLAVDVTGDGTPDLITASPEAAAVSVLRNQGDGTFLEEEGYDLGGQPIGIAALDLEQDGDIDLAVADTQGLIHLLANQGDGLMAPQETLSVTGFPRAIVAADFDQDGKDDLAVARLTEERISYLLHRDNSFEVKEELAAGFPVALLADDFDQDGAIDLAVAYSATDEVGVNYNDGAGGVSEERRFAVGKGPILLAGGDLSGDGLPDISILNGSDDDSSVLLSQGGRDFAPEARVGELLLFSSIAVGDVDEDGHLDIALGIEQLSFARVFFGQGQGDFGVNPSLADDPALSVAKGDANQDGALDLLVRTASTLLEDALLTDALISGDGVIWAARTDGSLLRVDDPTQAAQSLTVGGAPDRMLSADLSGDGRFDLVLADSVTGEVRLFLGQADGGLLLRDTLQGGAGIVSLWSSDLDGDGREDLAVLRQDTATLSLYFGEESGFTEVALPVGGVPLSSVLLGEEIIVSSEDALLSLSPNGTRSFLAQPLDFGGRWSSLEAGDADNDGALELIAANSELNEALVLRRNGTGFTPLLAESFTAVGGVLSGDFSGDGALDLVLAPELTVLLSNP